MNYLLRQLEQLGYVERRDDPDDARAKRVYETARGTEVRLLLRSTMRTLEADWAAALGEPDLEQLRDLLLRLNEITHGATRG
jgi:DNA-binding MarR family transcriptional regulator